MGKLPERPLVESYWVIPGQLLAGGYLFSSQDEAKARFRLRRLLKSGVSFFIDFTEAGEKELKPYEPLLREEATKLSILVEYWRLPILDFSVPTVEAMKEILAIIETALAARTGIYIHCFAGIGRTGTVAGCLLVQQGLTGETALAELARLRQGTAFEGVSSPVTSEQRQMVFDWPDEIKQDNLLDK